VSKPLVTFVLGSYNQERFIREAVRGALAQTYSPLEIIFSDDCSQDRTFEVIQEEVAEYEGSHRILLNRNSRNLKQAGHVNRVMELAKGKLIVVAAGDDVSLPTRTEELVKVWENEKVRAIHSNCIAIDDNGVEGAEVGPGIAPTWSWQQMVKSGLAGGPGCTYAYDRTIFDTFGPLQEDVLSEDLVIPYRAALLGEIAYLDECLVKWRRHGANDSKDRDDVLRMGLPQYVDSETVVTKRHKAAYENWLRDTRLFLSIHPEMKAELQGAAEVIAAHIEFCKFKECVVESDAVDRLRCCLHTLKRTRILGVGSMTKAGFLAISPTTYYRVRRGISPTTKDRLRTWREELVSVTQSAEK
jgi:glycosyltransferase involved in cell wall biosynthesis